MARCWLFAGSSGDRSSRPADTLEDDTKPKDAVEIEEGLGSPGRKNL